MHVPPISRYTYLYVDVHLLGMGNLIRTEIPFIMQPTTTPLFGNRRCEELEKAVLNRDPTDPFIAVCMYRLVMISIDLPETAHFSRT